MVKNKVKDSFDGFLKHQAAFVNAMAKLTAMEHSMGCLDGRIIGTGHADFTKGATEYALHLQDKTFVLIDIPGIEGNERKYRDIIKGALTKAHVIFYVNGSDKKAEKGTLEKIKDYMHTGTSVYAVYNVHCTAKKNPVKGLDKSYREELAAAYVKEHKVAKEAEVQLKEFLGDNYKGSISLNGLLSFCAVTVDACGDSTVFQSKDKDLRSTQDKLLREYSGQRKTMWQDSQILGVQNVIAERLEHFEEYILEENLKKLKTKLADMLSDVTKLRDEETVKIEEFLRIYDDFEKSCEIAKEDFLRSMKRIGHDEVENAFFPVQEAMFAEIERNDGKAKHCDLEGILNRHRDQIAADIKNAVNSSLKKALEAYQEDVQDAEKRMHMNLKRYQKQFENAMSTKNLFFDASIKKGLGYSFKNFKSDAFTVAKYTLAGLSIGSVVPVLGNVIGAAIGFIAGVFVAVADFFSSAARRINKLKEKVKKELEKQIDAITEDVVKEIAKMNIEAKIIDNYTAIQSGITGQKESLRNIEKTLNTIVSELKTRYNSI